MNIQCESCQARYNLDERLFRDSRAVRVKCRKCGGYIVVARAEAPEAPPVVTPPAEPVPGAPPAAELSAPPMPPSGEELEEPDMVVIMAMLEEMLDKLPSGPLPTSPPVAALTAPTMPPLNAEKVVPPPPKRQPLRCRRRSGSSGPSPRFGPPRPRRRP